MKAINSIEDYAAELTKCAATGFPVVCVINPALAKAAAAIGRESAAAILIEAGEREAKAGFMEYQSAIGIEAKSVIAAAAMNRMLNAIIEAAKQTA